MVDFDRVGLGWVDAGQQEAGTSATKMPAKQGRPAIKEMVFEISL